MSAKSPYQVFIIAPELMTDRSLSLSSRVVLGRLGGYTKRGAQVCWPTNQALALECGLAIHSVSDAIKELSQREIIVTWNTLFNGKKIRYIKIIYRSPAYIPCGSDSADCSSNELSENELSSNENSNNEQFNNSSNELSNCSSDELSSSIHTIDTTKEVHEDISATAQPQKAKPSKNKPIYPQSKEQCYTLFNEHRGMSETNIGVCTKRTDGYVQNAQQGTEINTDINTGVNTEVAPSQNFDPQLEANIAFYEFMQETNTQGDCAPQIDNHTQTRNFATSVQNNAPVEPAKPKRERKPRVQQPIPQSADEVMPYIEKFLKRHEKEGAYSNINKAHYAGRILDYYLKDDGTWRDNKNNIIHEPYRKVSAWLSKEYENGKLVIDTGSKPIDIFSDEFDEEVRKLERELSGEDENTPIEASYEFVDDEETQLLEDKKDE